ncbi:MAG: GNAT family N-acetyltransferase, partial [Actinomycetes bacterium]
LVAFPTMPDSPPARPRIRAMEPQDLPFAVHQHQLHFPDGFFVRLGPRFLTEYYRAFLTSPCACAYIAEAPEDPMGYLVGVTEPTSHRDHVFRVHGRRLAVRAFAAFLRHPALAWFFVRTRATLYGGKLLARLRPAAATTRPESRGAPAVLTHVAVKPQAQSKGVGSTLIKQFEADVAEAGCPRMILVTASGSSGAGGYYRRSGWDAREEHCTPDGLRLTMYERMVTCRNQAEPRVD